MSESEPPEPPEFTPCLFCGGDCSGAETCDGRQGKVEDREAYKRARTTDPDTSHEAAEAIGKDLKELQRRVMEEFDRHGPLTHHRLIQLYREHYGFAAESTIRTRCAELVEMGLVEDSGIRQTLRGKRKAIVWRLVQA